jgi:lysozyme family protein
MDGHVVRIEEKSDLYRDLVGKTEGKGTFVSCIHRRENNITLGLHEEV